jgi:hypothetical protein
LTYYDYDLLWGSGLPLGLALAAVAWGFVLVYGIERSCGRVYSSVSKAEQRASTLLMEWLSPEQCLQYKRLGYFEVRGSHSGMRYRIRCARQTNVEQLDERGHHAATLCFLPEKYVPVGDVMLAQKIMLENDEPAALRVAMQH